jgi:hypothetical protein
MPAPLSDDPDGLQGRLRALTATADRAVADVNPHALARASLSRSAELRRRRWYRGVGMSAAVLAIAVVVVGAAGLAGVVGGSRAPAGSSAPSPTPTSLPSEPSRELKARLAALPQTHVRLANEGTYARLGLPYDLSLTPQTKLITVHLPGGRTVPLGAGWVPDASLSPDGAYAVLNICDEEPPNPPVQFGPSNPGRLVIVEMATGRTTQLPNPGDWALVGRTLVLGTPAGAPGSAASANNHFVLRSFPAGTFPNGVIQQGGPDGQIVASSSGAGLLLTWYQGGTRATETYTLYDVNERKAVTLPVGLSGYDLTEMSQDGRVLVGRGATVWIRSGSNVRQVPGLPAWLDQLDAAPMRSDDGRFVFVLSMPAAPTYLGAIACDPRGWNGTGAMPCARVVLDGGVGMLLQRLELDVSIAQHASPSASPSVTMSPLPPGESARP